MPPLGNLLGPSTTTATRSYCRHCRPRRITRSSTAGIATIGAVRMLASRHYGPRGADGDGRHGGGDSVLAVQGDGRRFGGTGIYVLAFVVCHNNHVHA